MRSSIDREGCTGLQGFMVAGSPLLQGGRSTSWARATVEVASMATQLKTAIEARIGDPPVEGLILRLEHVACRAGLRHLTGPDCMAGRTDFPGVHLPRATLRRRPWALVFVRTPGPC